jgi:adenosylhomocysteine nucleosidase
MREVRHRCLQHRLRLIGLVLLLVAFATQIEAQTRPLLVLYAFPEEGQTIAKQMTADSTARILGRAVQMGTLNGKKIVLAESGVGMTNAAMTTQELITRFHPRGLVFSGIAGAIDSTVHIGDLCICSSWITHDYVYCGPDSLQPQPVHSFSAKADSLASFWSFFADSGFVGMAKQIDSSKLSLQKIGTREPRIIIGGAGVSGNAFIDNAEKRIWLKGRFGAMVTDMESSAVAQVCTANGVPFVIIRSASDLAGGSPSKTATEQLDQFFRIAASNSAALVMALVGLLP